MKRELKPIGDPCRLDCCPPGLFLFNGRLGFRSEYWTSSIKPDAYVVESGEYFWGGTDGTMDRAALIVQPVEMVEADAALSAIPADPVVEPATEERARIVAWLQTDDVKRHHPLTDEAITALAAAIECGTHIKD